MKITTRVGLIGTVVLAAGLFIGKVVYSPSFYLATKFECLRDSYIQKVIREEIGDLPEYVAGVNYIDSTEANGYMEKHGLNELTAMHTFGGNHNAIQIGNMKIKSKISVLPYSFEEPDLIQTEEDFRSTLVDHEINHAKHFYSGFPSIERFSENEKFDDNVLEIVNELSALRVEIANFPKRKISRNHMVQTLTRYMVYYCNLWDTGTQSHLQPGMTEALQDLFFEDWMRKSNVYRIDGNGRFVLNPKNGEEWLRLPE